MKEVVLWSIYPTTKRITIALHQNNEFLSVGFKCYKLMDYIWKRWDETLIFMEEIFQSYSVYGQLKAGLGSLVRTSG